MFSRETPGYLNCYCSINAIEHRFFMSLLGCEACRFVSRFTNIEYTGKDKTRKPRKTIAGTMKLLLHKRQHVSLQSRWPLYVLSATR